MITRPFQREVLALLALAVLCLQPAYADREGKLFLTPELRIGIAKQFSASSRSLSSDQRTKLPHVSPIDLKKFDVAIPRLGRLRLSLPFRRNLRWKPIITDQDGREKRDLVTERSLFLKGKVEFRSRKRKNRRGKKKERHTVVRPVAASFIPLDARSDIYKMTLAFNGRARRRKRSLDFTIQAFFNPANPNSEIAVRATRTPVKFESAGCGVGHDHVIGEVHEPDTELTAHLRSTGLKDAVIEMRLTASYDWAQEFGAQAGAHMVSIVNTAETTTYEPDLNTRFEIVEQTVQTSPTALTTSNNMETILRDWTSRQMNDFPETIDLSHLFVSRTPSNSTIGIAWLGTLCFPTPQYRSYGTGVTNSRSLYGNMPFSSEWRIFAHEIGHNIGMPHDSQFGACSGTGFGYLMYPSINSADRFSPCSISQAIPYLNRSCTDSRLPPPPTPYDISGTLRDETGAVVAAAKVTAVVGGITYTAITGAEGQFTFADVLGPDEITISVEKTGYTFTSSTMQLNSNLNLNLVGQTQQFTVSGTVLDRELNPVPEVNIQVTADGTTSNLTTAANGVFSGMFKFSRLYTIRALSPGCFFARTSETRLYGNNVHTIICDDP